MKGYRFSFEKREYTLISEELPSSSASCADIRLSPSLLCDAALEFDEKRMDGICAAVISASHLLEQRGLPLDEIEFATPVSNYIITNKQDFYSVRFKKCKYKFTETELDFYGCALKAARDSEGSFVLFETESLEGVKAEALSELALTAFSRPYRFYAAFKLSGDTAFALTSAPSPLSLLPPLQELLYKRIPRGCRLKLSLDGNLAAEISSLGESLISVPKRAIHFLGSTLL